MQQIAKNNNASGQDLISFKFLSIQPPIFLIYYFLMEFGLREVDQAYQNCLSFRFLKRRILNCILNIEVVKKIKAKFPS